MRIIHCAPFNIITKSGGSLYANPIKISQGLIQNNHFVHTLIIEILLDICLFLEIKKMVNKK